MTVREVIRMGHPTLRELARPVESHEIDTQVFDHLIDDMRETLHHTGGIGLAAPQVGESIQVAVIEITDTQTRYGDIPLIPFSVYINPEIEVLNPETRGYWEGCLSIPGLRGLVERPQHIRVSYRNRAFEPCTLELQGFPATVFQHEFDHLKGILYVDRLSDMSRFSFEEEFLQFQSTD